MAKDLKPGTGKRPLETVDDVEMMDSSAKKKKDDKFGPALYFCVQVLQFLVDEFKLDVMDLCDNLAVTGPFQSLIYLSKTLTGVEPKSQIFDKIKTQGISIRAKGVDSQLTYEKAQTGLAGALANVVKVYPNSVYTTYIGTVFQCCSLLSNFAYNWRVLHVGETVVKENDGGGMRKVRSIADMGFNPVTQSPLARGFIMKDTQASSQPTSLGFATVLYHARRSQGNFQKKWVNALKNQLRGLDVGDSILRFILDNREGSVSMVNKLGEIMMLSGSRYKRRFAIMPLLFCSYIKEPNVLANIEEVGFSRWENMLWVWRQSVKLPKGNQLWNKSMFLYVMATFGSTYDDLGVFKSITGLETFKRQEISKEEFEMIKTGMSAGAAITRSAKKFTFQLGFNMNKNNISDFLSKGSSQCISDPITNGFRVRSFVKYNENLKKRSQQISAGSMMDSVDRLLDEIKDRVMRDPKMKMGHVNWLDPLSCEEKKDTIVTEEGEFYFE